MPAARNLSASATLTGILFDLDDTLADLSAVERVVQPAIQTVLADRIPGLDLEAMAARYEEAFDRHWDAYLVSDTDFRTYRVNLLGEALAPWTELDDDLYAAYREAKVRQVDNLRPYADAVPTLRAIRAAGLAVGILTNGPSALQRRKLEITGLADEVDAVAISEELGVAKPDPAAFHAAAALLGADPAGVAMVGDSPAYDIAGALGAGLAAAVWVRRVGSGSHDGAVVVRSLGEVPPALGL